MKRILFLLLAINFFTCSYGQEEAKKSAIEVVARSFGDSIILRWAPNNPMAWKLSNKEGYIIERYVIQRDGKPNKKLSSKKQVLTSTPLKPWNLDKWESLAKFNNYGAIAAQAIHGKSFELTNTREGDIMRNVGLAQELESRFSFALFSADQSLKVAEASGLMFTDINVKKGEKYVYKIYSSVSPSVYKIDTGFVFIGTDEIKPLPKPLQLKAEFRDKAVLLSWNKVYFEHIYSSYVIERSDDGGNTFYMIDILPIVNTSPGTESHTEKMYKVDSLPLNDVQYSYRIWGKTIFEEIGPPSDTVQGSGEPKGLQLAPHITSVKNQKDGTLKIEWRFPKEYNSKLKEFELLRSDKVNGEYTMLTKVKPELREFKDSKPGRVNYYIVKVIELTDNSVSSFPALGQPIDSIPPLAPQGLTGNINKSGILNLHWNKVSDTDVFGYRVYMSNSLNDEFTQITKEPVRDTLFNDTVSLNTLTSKIYYKVMALDLNYNLSSFSSAIAVKRPDIVPPVPPRFESYRATDTSIYLRWIPSTSTDVVKHVLLRKESNTNSWITIFEENEKRNEYHDQSAKPKTKYEYAIVAIDDSQLESEKQPLSLSLIDYAIMPGVENVEIKADRLTKEVELKWTYVKRQPERFLIYRSIKGEPLKLYKSIEGTQNVFIDKSMQLNTTYEYRIKASFSDGGTSPLSKVVEIKY